jgi:hypothetical protein
LIQYGVLPFLTIHQSLLTISSTLLLHLPLLFKVLSQMVKVDESDFVVLHCAHPHHHFVDLIALLVTNLAGQRVHQQRKQISL